MSLLIEIMPLLNGIPETAGLLAAGTAMTASAIYLRGALGRTEAKRSDDAVTEKSEDQK